MKISDLCTEDSNTTLTTLDESRLLCGLQKYANDNARKYNSIPKMMVYNTALLSALSGYTYRPAFTSPKIWGVTSLIKPSGQSRQIIFSLLMFLDK